jgi:selenocysteine lyase/cysteine desulfurase
MLSVIDAPPAVDLFAELRRNEFARLDETGVAYLDYTGTALYADRQITRHLDDLRHHVLGNPHSVSTPSLDSTALIEDARQRVLRFLDADPNEYDVVFTANCSAALKLVAESYPFRRLSELVLAADNHNSVNGLREYARRQRADVTHIPLDAELRLADPARYLQPRPRPASRLFAFAAQSNFSGVQHPLSLVGHAQQAGYDVLLDAAAFVPTNALSLRACRPEFVVLSFYKLFGYPTGVGALVARRDALARLNRPWFAGGTVNYVSVQNGLHELKDGPERFEDGTPSFATIAALRHGFDLIEDLGVGRIKTHVTRLTGRLIHELCALGRRARATVRIYGPRDLTMRGATVTFNVVENSGRCVPFSLVERAARDHRIALRGGCFCNPGAAEHAFGFDAPRARRCLRMAYEGGFTVERFARCMSGDAVGAVRASIGLATNDRDVERLVELIHSISKR